MGVEAPQRTGLSPKAGKPGHAPSLGPPQEGEKGSLQEGRKKTSSTSASGLHLTRPQDGGDCWCQGGVVSAESRNVGRPPPWKEKSIKSPGAPAPPPSPCTKKCKTLSQKGISERPLAWAPEAHALALPCPGHRVRRGRALGQGALVGDPRPARAQAGPRHAGAQWASPPHTAIPAQGFRRPLPTLARASELWPWARDWLEVGGCREGLE